MTSDTRPRCPYCHSTDLTNRGAGWWFCESCRADLQWLSLDMPPGVPRPPMEAEPDMADVLARADDLHRRIRAVLLEAERACKDVAPVVARTECEERDEAAMGAATGIAGRM